MIHSFVSDKKNSTCNLWIFCIVCFCDPYTIPKFATTVPYDYRPAKWTKLRKRSQDPRAAMNNNCVPKDRFHSLGNKWVQIIEDIFAWSKHIKNSNSTKLNWKGWVGEWNKTDDKRGSVKKSNLAVEANPILPPGEALALACYEKQRETVKVAQLKTANSNI